MNNEYHEQVMLVNYISSNYPNVLIVSTLNGVYLTPGLAKKMSVLNPTRGIPDLFLMYPSGNYHGLAIEMKATGKSVNKKGGELKKDPHVFEQAEVLNRLQQLNYCACFAIGFEEGKLIVDQYMKQK